MKYSFILGCILFCFAPIWGYLVYLFSNQDIGGLSAVAVVIVSLLLITPRIFYFMEGKG